MDLYAGLVDDDKNGFWAFLTGTCGLLCSLGSLVLFIAALISILRADRLSTAGKVLWAVVAFAFPFVGSLAWFFWGKNNQDKLAR
ncbi:PLD nuclease N-terminal domain-containing protein [Longispora albida]|uniref:PLD nuclease N-terminal domain-containing protein n=1 Tax=Longispora albida TaxID=203523 RepID=UPI000377D963|nr:PLD nuclease N-terminal domain-containing protein [Longispora albida]